MNKHRLIMSVVFMVLMILTIPISFWSLRNSVGVEYAIRMIHEIVFTILKLLAIWYFYHVYRKPTSVIPVKTLSAVALYSFTILFILEIAHCVAVCDGDLSMVMPNAFLAFIYGMFTIFAYKLHFNSI